MSLDLSKAAFLVGVVGVLVAHWQSRRMFQRQRAIVQKYRLYAVRDKLIYLIASRKISETDQMFVYFYESVTIVIKKTDTLNLRSLIKVLSDLRANGLDPADKNILVTLADELKKKPPEVAQVVAAFYQTVLQIFLENSFILRALARCPWLPQAALAIKRWLSTAFRPLPPFTAYSFYREYRDAEDAVGHPHQMAA